MTPPSPSPAPGTADDAVGDPPRGHSGEDVLLYTGTGVILAMAVDADDNLVFSMEDAPAVSGGVFMLRMAPGGVLLLPRDDDADAALGGGGGEQAPSSDGASSPAVSLAGGLGPFLPGVAVCPATGDVYVSRGHTGIVRLLKDADGGFGNKVRLDSTILLAWGTERAFYRFRLQCGLLVLFQVL